MLYSAHACTAERMWNILNLNIWFLTSKEHSVESGCYAVQVALLASATALQESEL